MVQQESPIVKQPPIYLATPQPRRTLPIALLIVVLSVGLLMLSNTLEGDSAAVLAAFGCAGMIASIYRPTRAATSERVYTVRVAGRLWRMYGDEETDKMVDEGRW